MMKQLSFLMVWLCAMNIDVVKPHVLEEYIKNGLQLHCQMAIDCSPAVNGKSAHVESADVKKDYEHALSLMVEVFKHYDSDKIFSVYGFGATTSSSSAASVFGVSDHPASGVQQAYTALVGQIQSPASPNLAPVVRHIAEIVRKAEANKKNYFVLVVLTDGQIADKEDTVKAVVEASALPLSIVAVGIGKHDFQWMEILDGDKTPLEANGRKALRDIVQFVPLDEAMAKGKVAVELVAELPGQVDLYMKSK